MDWEECRTSGTVKYTHQCRISNPNNETINILSRSMEKYHNSSLPMVTQSYNTLHSTPETQEKCIHVCLLFEMFTNKELPMILCTCWIVGGDAKWQVLMCRSVAYGCIREKQETFEWFRGNWKHFLSSCGSKQYKVVPLYHTQQNLR